MDALAILMTNSSSKGEELLFRYPCDDGSLESNDDQSGDARTVKPYSVKLPPRFQEITNQFKLSLGISSKGRLAYSDAVLSQFLAVQSHMADKLFDVKVDDVQFVGYPVAILHSREREERERCSSAKSSQPSNIVNVLLALTERVNEGTRECYKQLCKQIAMAIKHEERRCCFFCNQRSTMAEIIELYTHRIDDRNPDDGPLLHPSTEMLQKEMSLPVTLRNIFESVKKTGTVMELVNEWTEVNFCLPSVVHNLPCSQNLRIMEEDVQRSIELIRPYHAMLLLVDANEFVQSLPIDSSPALVRVIRVTKPRQNLLELAADSDLELSQVFKLVNHLVYWGKAMIIYPLCELNVYVLSPLAPLSVRSDLAKKFRNQFKEKLNFNSLAEAFSEFSNPTKLGDRNSITDSREKKTEMVQIVKWLLQHRLIMQLHTYLYLRPSILEEEHLQAHQPISSEANISKDDSQTAQSSKPAEEAGGEKLSSLKEATYSGLRKYFDGRHHLEEIMFYENMSLPSLMNKLDKYLPLLYKVQAPDPAASFNLSDRGGQIIWRHV